MVPIAACLFTQAYGAAAIERGNNEVVLRGRGPRKQDFVAQANNLALHSFRNSVGLEQLILRARYMSNQTSKSVRHC